MDNEISALRTAIRPAHRWREFLSLKQRFRGKIGGWTPKRMKKPGWYAHRKPNGVFNRKKGTDKDTRVLDTAETKASPLKNGFRLRSRANNKTNS